MKGFGDIVVAAVEKVVAVAAGIDIVVEAEIETVVVGSVDQIGVEVAVLGSVTAFGLKIDGGSCCHPSGGRPGEGFRNDAYVWMKKRAALKMTAAEAMSTVMA